MKNKKNFASRIKDRNIRIEQLKDKAKKKSSDFLAEAQYLHSLIEITQSINKLQDFQELLERIVDSAISLTRAERGFIVLYHENGCLEFKVTRNINEKTLTGDENKDDEEYQISKTVINQVLATGKPIFLRDIYKDKKFKISTSIEILGLHMIMCVPLKSKEQIFGVLYVDSRSEIERFTELEERIFMSFAAQTSIAIENNRLYELSVHDALTGLYNYAYLHTCLESEISRALRDKKENISFIMIDLDKFKDINDSYGHLFGNSILAKIADIIKKSVRKYDIAARYGGDEFAILMPNANVREARFLAERLQKEISAVKFSIGKISLTISLSIGISSFPAEHIANSETVILEADNAMFVAKSKGRNQIAIFGLRKDREKHEPELVGKSKTIIEIGHLISQVAVTDATILIIGETGTGKELVTKLVHKMSPRSDMPLVVVNCGAIPDNLLESELFGFEKGAFTGAYRQHKGKFESAQGGTILLDEIGELPLYLQVKLLRAIEQKEIDRIGGKSPIKVDVRIIAASNRDLEAELKKGNFRKDLYYRLSVATIYLPPLRERPEDIDVLSEYYLNQMNERYRRKFVSFTKGAMEVMMRHFWPGNVRELINRIERAVIMGRGQYIDEECLGLSTNLTEKTVLLKEAVNETEKEFIKKALIRNRWKITRSAKELGISRQNLRHLMKKHNIMRSDV